MPKVPQLDLTGQFAEIREDVLENVIRVLESGHYILGPEVQAFEHEMAAYLDTEHCIGVANGSDSVALSLQALGVGPGDTVIVPAYTFIATATGVSRVGARPVFCDIEPGSFNLDPSRLEELLDLPDLKAVVPVHLFGLSADLDRIQALVAPRGIRVLEDNAQAPGGNYKGKKTGTVGDLGSFSFFPSKNLGACGDAGMICTRDPDLAARVRRLRVHGQVNKYEHAEIGINSRLDPLQATILRVKLRHLDAWNAGRRRVAATYREFFDQAGLLASDPTGVEPGTVVLQTDDPESPSVYHQYVIRVHETLRDHVLSSLREADIGCAIYYPLPLHHQACFEHLGENPQPLPESERASRETLAIPIFPELGRADQERVVEVIRTALTG